MNILLVDDEIPHLKGLSLILSQTFPDICIQCADNVSSALKLLDTFHADVILTDVEMPVLSGFDLIKELHAKSGSGKIIIISAHDKFSYAQKAVEYGVISYILKPFSTDTVTAALKKAFKILSDEKSIQEKELQLNRQLSDTMPVYISHMLNKLAYDVPAEKEYAFFHDIFSFSCPYAIIFTHFQKTLSLSEQQDFPLYLRQTLRPFGRGLSFLCEKHPDTFCTVFQLSAAKPSILCDIQQVLSQLFYKNYMLTFEISRIYPTFPRDFSSEFSALLLFSNTHYFSTGNKVMLAGNNPSLPEKDFHPDERTTEKLLEAVKNKNEKECVYLINELFRLHGRRSFPQKEIFLTELEKIMRRIFSLLYRLDSKTEYTSLYQQFSEAFRQAPLSVSALTVYTNTALRVIMELESVSDHNAFLLIEDCMDYIQKHYMDDLSLDSVALKYHFNASYFSTLFRTCTNQNFSEYLTHIRLQKSIELLTQTDDRIYQIAQAVGYNDSAYFNRVFRKNYGVSPEKYRRLIKKLEDFR